MPSLHSGGLPTSPFQASKIRAFSSTMELGIPLLPLSQIAPVRKTILAFTHCNVPGHTAMGETQIYLVRNLGSRILSGIQVLIS